MTFEAPELNAGSPSSPRKPLSRRALVIGWVIAVLLLASLGGLVWYLTKPAALSASTSFAPGPGGSAGPGS